MGTGKKLMNQKNIGLVHKTCPVIVSRQRGPKPIRLGLGSSSLTSATRGEIGSVTLCSCSVSQTSFENIDH